MRIATLMAALAVVGTGAVAMGEQPATTQAQHDAVVPAEASGKVLVLPFDQMGGVASNYDWLGRAVQQNLITELGRARGVSPITPEGAKTASDVKAAVEAGKAAGADLVVFGSFQLLEQDLRINGQVVEVETGKIVGTLKSTGTVRDLFAMEDTVAQQARRLIAPPTQQAYRPGDLPLAIPAPQPQAQQQPVTPAPVQPPAVNSYANDYNRYTYYPSNYGYGYGLGYPTYGYAYPAYGYSYPSCWGYGTYFPTVTATRTVTAPIGVGTSAGMVASGMISVQGNFNRYGQLRN